ncbi:MULTISPECIES: type II toxin-antitoxin system RelE/ParE family toxin [unclassified Paraburkholderia]|uniref:type II toxin-antitoxin system RelE/ParE family toxin n=1 Tax=unclassified Paraburkholderia TaxID=2615204 RepID=UPI00160E01AA|nr:MULTISPECIES: type II toxin-antitoxin system RelE/ParE family toxin [unclassified Paraburkholderia]MBB5441472.1 phage-related protein [Paraburkholderia sp. WSM4177]MBB5481867.1 phage-related protein [Paraburkholderia sp. WSM4180]
MEQEKEIRWLGSSYRDLLVFPDEARRLAGFQLHKIQSGLDPDDWKPFESIGAGTREIRIRDQDGIFRVMYVTKYAEALYVLHCFQKKTQRLRPRDRKIAEMRYRAITHYRTTQP